LFAAEKFKSNGLIEALNRGVTETGADDIKPPEILMIFAAKMSAELCEAELERGCWLFTGSAARHAPLKPEKACKKKHALDKSAKCPRNPMTHPLSGEKNRPFLYIRYSSLVCSLGYVTGSKITALAHNEMRSLSRYREFGTSQVKCERSHPFGGPDP